MPILSAMWEEWVRELLSMAAQLKTHKTISEKQLKQKRAGPVAQVVQHLLSKHEVLSSNPQT
jgi:hypothetical protein